MLNDFYNQAVNRDDLVPRGSAPYDLQSATRTFENVSQELDESFVCRGIHRWRRYLDFQFGAQCFNDLVARRAGLHFDVQ